MRVDTQRGRLYSILPGTFFLLLVLGLPHLQAADAPVTGDWLVSHILSDPENLNPLTSNDSTSSRILSSVFESFLIRDPQTLEIIPQLAVARPQISADKLLL